MSGTQFDVFVVMFASQYQDFELPVNFTQSGSHGKYIIGLPQLDSNDGQSAEFDEL